MVLNSVTADELCCVTISDVLSDMVRLKFGSYAFVFPWNLCKGVLANV